MALAVWSPEELNALIKSGAAVLVDFKAPWCPQCGTQVRALERVASGYQGDVVIGTLDLGEFGAAAEEFGVSTLPTLQLYRGGAMAKEQKGFTKAPIISRMLGEFS